MSGLALPNGETHESGNEMQTAAISGLSDDVKNLSSHRKRNHIGHHIYTSWSTDQSSINPNPQSLKPLGFRARYDDDKMNTPPYSQGRPLLDLLEKTL